MEKRVGIGWDVGKKICSFVGGKEVFGKKLLVGLVTKPWSLATHDAGKIQPLELFGLDDFQDV